MDSTTKELRRVNGNISRALSASAITDGQWERLTREQYLAEKAASELSGLRRLHLVCGHVRTIDVATFEEEDMERTGTVQCRGTKPVIMWPSHRWQYVGVMGWQPES